MKSTNAILILISLVGFAQAAHAAASKPSDVMPTVSSTDVCKERSVNTSSINKLPGVTRELHLYRCQGPKGKYWSTKMNLIKDGKTIYTTSSYRKPTNTAFFPAKKTIPHWHPANRPTKPVRPEFVNLMTPRTPASSTTSIVTKVSNAVSGAISTVKSYLGLGN